MRFDQVFALFCRQDGLSKGTKRRQTEWQGVVRARGKGLSLSKEVQQQLAIFLELVVEPLAPQIHVSPVPLSICNLLFREFDNSVFLAQTRCANRVCTGKCTVQEAALTNEQWCKVLLKILARAGALV